MVREDIGKTGFCGMLTILFVGLKLTGYINWHWVWVVSPLWIPIAAALVVMAIALTVVLFLSLWNRQ